MIKKFFLSVLLTGIFCLAGFAQPAQAQQQGVCGGGYYTSDVSCPSQCPIETFSSGDQTVSCCGTIDPTQIDSGNFCKYTPAQQSNQIQATCGQTYSSTESTYTSCNCPSGVSLLKDAQTLCCGWPGYVGAAARCYAEESVLRSCGETFAQETDRCPQQCGLSSRILSGDVTPTFCCGYFSGDTCVGTVPQITPQPSQIIDSQFLADIDPLMGSPFLVFFQRPAGIVNELLKLAFPLAGIILFMMIVWGGFEMLYGAASSKAQEAGKQRITAAIIGFVLLFVSYWIAQILQTITGVNIFG